MPPRQLPLFPWVESLFLVVFVLLALWLRFNLTLRFAYFNDDMSRDVLAMEHLVRYGEHHLAVPMAMGGLIEGSPLLRNSFLYYYFLAPLYSLAPAPETLTIFLNIAAALNVVVIYITTRRLAGRWAAATAAMFFATNIAYIEMSRDLWQPFFLTAIFPWIFYLWVIVWQHHSRVALIAASILFAVAIHFHLSTILLLPLFVLVVSSYWWRQPRRQKRTIAMYLCIVIGNVLIWLAATGQLHWQANLVQYTTVVLSGREEVVNDLAVTHFEDYFFYGRNQPLALTFLIGLTLLVPFPMLFRYLQQKKLLTPQLELLLFFFVTAAIFLVTSIVFPPKFYYFIPFYLLWATWLGIGVAQFRWPVRAVLFAVIFFFSLVSAQLKLMPPLQSLGPGAVEKSAAIAQFLVNDFQQRHPGQALALDLDGYYLGGRVWFRSKEHNYWYFLERLAGRQLVWLETENARVRLGQPAVEHYLICVLENGVSPSWDGCLFRASDTIFLSQPERRSQRLVWQQLTLPAAQSSQLWQYSVYRLQWR